MMKFFKDDATAAVYAYEADGSQDAYILAGLRAMTEQEVHDHLNPAPAPAPVPQTITRAQGRLVLYRQGLWSAVMDYVAGISDAGEQFEADAALNHTSDWQRSSPFLMRAAKALDLDGHQLDELFREAVNITP